MKSIRKPSGLTPVSISFQMEDEVTKCKRTRSKIVTNQVETRKSERIKKLPKKSRKDSRKSKQKVEPKKVAEANEPKKPLTYRPEDYPTMPSPPLSHAH